MGVTATLLLATNNSHKVSEFRRLLAGLPMRIATPAELGLRLDVTEDGSTFAENAVKKAVAFAKASGTVALADDSGIEVAALGGKPGIHSARYGGPGLSDADRMHLLLRELQQTAPGKRQCRYVAVVAVAWPDGRVETFEGTCDGTVAYAPAGENGFGYDPVFLLPERGKTIAQLSAAEKDAMSHRGKAARKAMKLLQTLSVTSPRDVPRNVV